MIAPHAPRLLGLAFALAGCSGTAQVARVATTSSAADAQSRPAASRTVDSAGFVDNGGRPSSETARTQMSGMRATEGGGDRPTGTPGAGIPVPPLDGPRPADDTCMLQARERGRRALCDREPTTAQLQRCASALRQLDCGSPAASLEGVEACEARVLCGP